MKAAVALLCSVSILAGCFPNNPQHRTYAKYAEGAALVAGIAISAFANTGADCDQMDMQQGPNIDNDCRKKARWLGTTGLLLILGGLLGFVATIATTEDIELKKEQKQATDNPVKSVKLPPGVTPPAKTETPQTTPPTGAGSGSAAEPAPTTPPGDTTPIPSQP